MEISESFDRNSFSCIQNRLRCNSTQFGIKIVDSIELRRNEVVSQFCFKRALANISTTFINLYPMNLVTRYITIKVNIQFVLMSVYNIFSFSFRRRLCTITPLYRKVKCHRCEKRPSEGGTKQIKSIKYIFAYKFKSHSSLCASEFEV